MIQPLLEEEDEEDDEMDPLEQLEPNKFSEALDSFEQAKRIQPNNVKAIYNYSVALLHLDRPQEAQRLLRRILELDSTHQKATIALSHLNSPIL
ncbi:hypothetical protein JG688_00009955 [Phytophthora aleatoria]|uniref:Tetratricopeptide repeat protein n=1 Tax=Phytophthora aleatoria TaxID=2496075 RepID=A0A8J5J658_9STRA|nr:hypothetical protein JG688_00009955 [Phytophthora aleatoria]